jgi:Ca2+-binding RTX toxin-like protein
LGIHAIWVAASFQWRFRPEPLTGGEGDDPIRDDDIVLVDDRDTVLLHGNVTIEGGGGNDRIETHYGANNDVFHGSIGRDILEGGAGTDTFQFAKADLQDESTHSTIADASAQDRIVLDGVQLDTLSWVSRPNDTWESSDGSILLSLKGADLTIQTLTDHVPNPGMIVVKDFANSILGLSLPQTPPINHAPTASGTLENQTVTETEPYSWTLPANLFADEDGDALTYTVTQVNGDPLPNWLTFNPDNRNLSGTPIDGDEGSLDLRVMATDTYGESAMLAWKLDIAPVNHAPKASWVAPDQTITETGFFTYTIPAGLFVDDDGDALTITVVQINGNPLPEWLTFDAETGTLSGTPADGDRGALKLRILATDPDGASGRMDFGLDIAAINHAPTASGTIPLQTATETEAFAWTLPAGLFSDSDGDALTYSIILADGNPLPTWLMFETASLTLSGTPNIGDAGALALAVTATDPSGAWVSQQFTLDVASPYNVLSGTMTDDTLVGTAGADRILGLEGNDALRGGEGDDILDGGNDADILYAGRDNDVLRGGVGGDRLYGEAGNDILRGGKGNDTLTDTQGDDTYYFALGDGADTVLDTQGNDTLIFEGIDYADLWFTQTGVNGRNLEISVQGTDDKITVTDWFLAPSRQIEHIQAGGYVLDAAEVAKLVEALAGYAPSPDLATVGGSFMDIADSYWHVV